MKRLFGAVAAGLLVFAVAACGPSGCANLGGAPEISVTADEKALYVVELAYAGGLLALETAVDAGAIQGERAREAIALLDQANSAVTLAREAYAVGDRLQVAVSISEAHYALGDLRGVINGGTGR